MNGHQFSISLRIEHPSMDPARITKALGIEPIRAWQEGVARTTPKGDPLAGTYRESYWNSGFLREGGWTPDAPAQDLHRAIKELLSGVAKHKHFLQGVRDGGGRVELCIGWFFDTNSGDVFDHDLLRELAEMQVDLSLEIYPPPDRANPKPPSEHSDASPG